MPREIIFQAPKQKGRFATVTGTELYGILPHADHLQILLDGGRDSEKIPLDGLSEGDRETIEAALSIVSREIETGEARTRSESLRAAAAAKAEQDAAEAVAEQARENLRALEARE